MYFMYVPQRFSLLGNACWRSSWTNKMIDTVEHKFYCPSLKKDVAKIVGQCRACQLAKQ